MPASASNGWSQRRHTSTLWFWRLRPRSDEGRAAAWFEHREGPLRNLAPDRVENSVAIGDGFLNVNVLQMSERRACSLVAADRKMIRYAAGSSPVPGRLTAQALTPRKWQAPCLGWVRPRNRGGSRTTITTTIP